MPSRAHDAAGALAEATIRLWVRVTGKRVAKQSAAWLRSPMGPGGPIGEEFYARLPELEGVRLQASPEAGLLEDFGLLRGAAFDPSAVRPEIREFYERTSCFDLEAWSDVGLSSRLFLWLLTSLVSRRMNQLNFPLSALELAAGMTSQVLPMLDASSGRRVYTGWLRKLAADGRVIYAGLYSVGRPVNHPDPCVKVSFPLPHGSSTVFLRPEVGPNGSFRLISAGSGFGGPGFYRMLDVDPEHWRVRFIKTLREVFDVYVDAKGTLRTDHTVRFLGFTVLRLHYKIERAPAAAA